MKIRTASRTDKDDISRINLAAFPEEENKLISNLATDLLALKTTPITLSLVAESEASTVGHAAFSPVTFTNCESIQGYILAPLAVKPCRQKTGIGSSLVEDGIRRLSKMDVDILFVYGDPKYYGRFGFSAAIAEPFKPPYDLQFPFGWLAMPLDKALAKEWSGPIACVPPLCNPELW